MAKIAREEGFAVHREKSSLRTAAARQSVCGVVVNAHPNVARAEYDQLKAILHNAALHGPENQSRAGVTNLQAHLRGRIAWVASLNPGRGQRFADASIRSTGAAHPTLPTPTHDRAVQDSEQRLSHTPEPQTTSCVTNVAAALDCSQSRSGSSFPGR